jgi:hypothetical protein
MIKEIEWGVSGRPLAVARRTWSARKGRGKPGNGQVVNSVEFLLPCDPEKFGAAGPDWQLKARSLRAASNARKAASEERDLRPFAKVSCCWWFLVSWPPDPVVATNRLKFH